MRELNFYGTWPDSWLIIDALLESRNLELVADLWYDKPVCRIIDALSDEWKQMLQKRRRFYLVRKGAPLHRHGFVEQREGLRAGQYIIDLTSLAFGAECVLPACFEQDGLLMLNAGSVALPHEFWLDPLSDAAIPPDADTVRLYDQAVKCVQRACIRQVVVHHKGWVGRDAAARLRVGEARVIARGA